MSSAIILRREAKVGKEVPINYEDVEKIGLYKMTDVKWILMRQLGSNLEIPLPHIPRTDSRTSEHLFGWSQGSCYFSVREDFDILLIGRLSGEDIYRKIDKFNPSSDSESWHLVASRVMASQCPQKLARAVARDRYLMPYATVFTVQVGSLLCGK